LPAPALKRADPWLKVVDGERIVDDSPLPEAA
jgi:hypothetical protein